MLIEEESVYDNLPLTNKLLDFSSLLSTILSSQRTYLSLIRTISIFAALSVLIKNPWILYAVILLFIISIVDFYKNYQKIKKLVKKFNIGENTQILFDLTNYNYTLHGYSFILLMIFIILIIKFHTNKI